jgi:hypothetical protein
VQVQQTAAVLQGEGSRVELSTFADKAHGMPAG